MARPRLSGASAHMVREAAGTAREHLSTIRDFVRHVFGGRPVEAEARARAASSSHDAERDSARRAAAHHVRMAAHHAERGDHNAAAHHMRNAGDAAKRGGFHAAAAEAHAHADRHLAASRDQRHGGTSAREAAHASRQERFKAAAAARNAARSSARAAAHAEGMKNLQRGAKGGSFYVTSSGRKVYVRG